MKKIFFLLGVVCEDMVFILGIGCFSCFFYYMNMYGLYSIYGCVLVFVIGLKLSCFDLMVWVIMGDGDGLSIGGNYLLYCI